MCGQSLIVDPLMYRVSYCMYLHSSICVIISPSLHSLPDLYIILVIAKRRASASEARLMIASYSSFCYIYIYVCVCPHLMQAGATVAQA